MATKKKMLQAAAGSAGGGGGFTAIEDVFSTYLYTGTSGSLTVNNGIDLLGEGGMVWHKGRDIAEYNNVFDTERGDGYILRTEVTQASDGPFFGQAFTSTGFSLNTSDNQINSSSNKYASWTFRKAPRFFDVVTYTGDGTSGREIAHNLGVAPGAIILKRLDATSNWPVYHRGIDATNPENYAIELNATDPRSSSSSNHWNSTNPTATEFTIGANYNGNSTQWVAYLFAHDPLGPSEDGSDGLIACGSYTGNGSSNGPEIDLGWEPQWVLVKAATGGAEEWFLYDSMRGWLSNATAVLGNKALRPNDSAVEWDNDFSPYITSTGFELNSSSSRTNASGVTYIYIAIRRGPMRAPESGTEVFGMDDYTGGGDGPVSGFVTDMAILGQRTGTDKFYLSSRLTGDKYMLSPSTAAELSQGNQKWDRMDGAWNTGVSGYMLWGFARAPSFFDVVAYTGDGVAGRTVPHNLGVAPEMMWVKNRTGAAQWTVYFGDETSALDLSETSLPVALGWWNNTTPTDSVFSVGSLGATNQSGFTYIAYLFATLAGVSKVGSYTGNGTSQTIDCGFTSGARFVLIKRATGVAESWYVFDSVRGITSSDTDPLLMLNNTIAEQTESAWFGPNVIEPNAAGFNLTSSVQLNVSGETYIFYAIA
jgi:hypothetical protein